ncbi:hypothetical protein BU17DRAFT_85084 [Hysterangium stoloniferum]|nr:hypothetical protein BU17DRAFT_85084 [Hysterangium stoloniferum]
MSGTTHPISSIYTSATAGLSKTDEFAYGMSNRTSKKSVPCHVRHATAPQSDISSVFETFNGEWLVRSESWSYSHYPECTSKSHPISIGSSIQASESIRCHVSQALVNTGPTNTIRGRKSSLKPANKDRYRNPHQVRFIVPVRLNSFLSHPPVAISLKRRVENVVKHAYQLQRPATKPPVYSMTIRSASIPSTITIIAYHGYITIADVLNGIHAALLSNSVRDLEYKKIHVTQTLRERKDQERLKSGEALRKIDPLEGRYVFQGLVYSGDDDEAYILKHGRGSH